VLVDAFGNTDEDGALRQVVVYYVDITKRRATEMELRRRIEVEALLSAISSEFISMAPQAVEAGLGMTLERLGRRHVRPALRATGFRPGLLVEPGHGARRRGRRG